MPFVFAMPSSMGLYLCLVYLCRGRVDQWKEAEMKVLRIVSDACNRQLFMRKALYFR